MPPFYKRGGGVDETLYLEFFDMLQYFEKILPSVESLWSSRQDKVYFMANGATGATVFFLLLFLIIVLLYYTSLVCEPGRTGTTILLFLIWKFAFMFDKLPALLRKGLLVRLTLVW